MADVEAMHAVRGALDRLGYAVVAGSEYLQFALSVTSTQTVKVDLLTAQLDVVAQMPDVQADARRARPMAKARPKLHAHPTDGALAVGASPLVIQVEGRRSTGGWGSAQVRLPHSFTYLLMKLTAYRGRRADADKDLGRHHALDISRIVAMLTESEAEEVRQRLARFADDHQVGSCLGLMDSDFASATSPGLLAMRQHPLWQNDAQIDVFIDGLQGLRP